MLTHKQHELLTYIDHVISTTGSAPSYEEMKEAVSLSSKAGVARLVEGLIERGFLKKRYNRARSLEVLRRPVSAGRAGHAPPAADLVRLPVLSAIISGVKTWALGDGAVVDVPAALVGPGTHFVVRMQGVSMVDDGIIDGDLLIIRECSEAVDFDLVLHVVGQRHHMIRRWRREGSLIRLDPGNRAFDPERLAPADVRIHGVVKGMMRTYG